MKREVKQLRMEREILKKKQRPGSLGRATRSPIGVRVREGVSGRVSDPRNVAVCWASPPAGTTPGCVGSRRIERGETQKLAAKIRRVHDDKPPGLWDVPGSTPSSRENGRARGVRRRVGPPHEAGKASKGVSRSSSRSEGPLYEARMRALRPIWSRRDFTANGPNQLWVADITYVPTQTGFFVPGPWSWTSGAARSSDGLWPRTYAPKLVLDGPGHGRSTAKTAAGRASQRPGHAVYVDSVRTPLQGIRRTGLRWESVGDCYDNAMAESFFATLECELLDLKRFHTQAEAQDGGLRLHRGLLQSEAASLFARPDLAPSTSNASTSAVRKAA